MKKATNIKEFANNLVEKPVSIDNKNFYVPLFKELISEMKDEIINNELENKTIYIAGQSGSGKTSAMNFLPDENINKNFIKIDINYRDLIAFDDIDIIDVLLMFGFKMTDKEPRLKDTFYKKLETIYKKHEGLLTIEKEKVALKNSTLENENTASVGFNFLTFIQAKAKFLTSFKMDKQIRKHTREIFEFRKVDLLEMVNEMIDLWYEYNGSKKKLLVVFDDFDKLRDPKQIYTTFIDNRNFLESIKCTKIISIPIHLATEANFNTSATHLKFFHLILFKNPSIKTHTHQKEIESNKKLLFDLIYRRGEEKLITQDALNYALEYSGGILRQFLSLIYDAAAIVRRLEGVQISKEDVRSAIYTKRKQLSITIIGKDLINLFSKIMKEHKPTIISENDELFIKALLNSQIHIHPNGEYWYDVNPILKRTIENYSQ